MSTLLFQKYRGVNLSSIYSIGMNWWQENGEKHWRKWGIWLWILLILTLWMLTSHALDDMYRGWQDSCQGKNYSYDSKASADSNFSSVPSTSLTFTIFLIFPMVLFFMVLIGIVLGQLHYWSIYKPIFKSYRIANLVLYVLTCFLIYDIVLAKYMFSEIEDKDSMAGAIWITSLLFSIIYDYKKSEEVRQALEKERDRAQIEMLKTQINPHFLFNTLNNLYGTALVEESPKTATGILQLAQIMRHAVESSELEEIEIEKEIRFLQDYIEQQKVRIPRRPNILINTKLYWDETLARIAPLIVMTFVENAFKHGINPEQDCFIDMLLLVENKRLTLICRNSIVTRIQVEKGTGMGLKNTIKRLQLLYPDRHFLDINSDNEVYEVSLTLNLT